MRIVANNIGMKAKILKRITALISAILAVAIIIAALSGCSEDEKKEDKSNVYGTAIALGHGNCVTEATVIADYKGRPIKVRFDDIFPASNVYNNTALGADAETVNIGGKDYYKYLRIGAKYFTVNENGTYSEMGTESGIADLMAYYKTDDGVRWYYNSFLSGDLYVCAESDDGKTVGEVKLADKYKFNTQYGSMRKRYSRYWSVQSGDLGQISGLGFAGNMEMLEEYLLTNGFNAVNGNSYVTLPGAEGNSGKFNIVGGVATGATLSKDTAVYLNTAKAAYDTAMRSKSDSGRNGAGVSSTAATEKG